MPASVAMEDDDEFQVHHTKKNANQQRRVYIGGLPNDIPNLEHELTAWIQEQVPTAADTTISVEVQSPSASSRKGTTFALIECGNQGSALISKLHQKTWHGKKLTVQREKKQSQQPGQQQQQQQQQKQKPTTQQRKAPNKTGAKFPNKNKKKNTFNAGQTKQSWGKSWSKPEKDDEPQSQSQSPRPAVPFTPIPVDQATEEIGAVVASEIKNAEENGDDVINVALASTAAASLLAAMNAFDDGTMPTTMTPGVHFADEAQYDNTTLYTDEVETKEKDTGFKLQDMSALLADFGQEDKDWMKQQVTVAEEKVETETTSRLAPHGKAPIHIVFRSFGYNYGAPKRPDGWSISQPLAPLDCTDFETVPPYLKWMSGLSGSVKRAIDPTLLDYARTVVADQVWDCLLQAQESGYGYASPLEMTIFLGSESGRHRAVAACEKAAAEFRKRLRKNVNNVIRQPVSVGTAHRDIDRSGGRNKNKKSEDDDDDKV